MHDSPSRADDHDGRATLPLFGASLDDLGSDAHAAESAHDAERGNPGASAQSGRRRLSERPITYSVTEKGWRA